MNSGEQLDLWHNKDNRNMLETSEIDQFQLLEEKIDALISLVAELKSEKEILAEKARSQENQIADLSERMESLTANREQAKQRIISLLEKIEQSNV